MEKKHQYKHVRKEFIRSIPSLQKAIMEISGGSMETCYTSSEIARRIFAKFGIESKVVFVTGVIWNEKAKELFSIYGVKPPFLDECIKQDGYTMGVGMGDDEQGVPCFHAVLYFPKQDEILDLTIYQLNRPRFGINMPKYFYSSAIDYLNLYSDVFDKRLFEWSDFESMFKPLVEREPSCAVLAERFADSIGRNLTKVKHRR